MTNQLSEKIALVTGGSSGIGLAAAKAFATEGATVIITGRDMSALATAVGEIPGKAEAIRGDVSKLSDLDQLYEQIRKKHGKLDIIFANAGVVQVAPFEDTTEEAFDIMMNTNVKGLYFTVQKALPLLSDGASIILNASIAGNKGFAGMSVYGATKAAVRAFTRNWTTELADRKIRVNSISAGPIETPIYGKLGLSEDEVKDWGETFVAQVPLARFGEAREVADTALFLASNNSSYINGIELTVDGGLSQV